MSTQPCPQCRGEMNEAQATNFGEKYWYCRQCKMELDEMLPKRGLTDDKGDYSFTSRMHQDWDTGVALPPSLGLAAPSPGNSQYVPVPFPHLIQPPITSKAAVPDYDATRLSIEEGINNAVGCATRSNLGLIARVVLSSDDFRIFKAQMGGAFSNPHHTSYGVVDIDTNRTLLGGYGYLESAAGFKIMTIKFY